MKAVIAVGAFVAGRHVAAQPVPGWVSATLIVLAVAAALWLLCVIVADWMKHN